MHRFIEPPLQDYKGLSPYLYYSKVNIPGLLRNIEIAADGNLLGCNTGNNIYKWASVSDSFIGISGNLY